MNACVHGARMIAEMSVGMKEEAKEDREGVKQGRRKKWRRADGREGRADAA